MSIAATKWVWEQKEIPLATRAVLLAVADMINRKGEAWPSVSTIAERCEISERMVQRHLSVASTLGVLNIKRETGKRSTYSLPTPDIYDTPTDVSPLNNMTLTPDICVTPPLYKNRNGTVNSSTTGEENKEIVLKILESLKALGTKPTKRTTSFVLKFANKHPELPLDWIDLAEKVIEDRDIDVPWQYMKKMLANWQEKGSPQDGFNGNRVPETNTDNAATRPVGAPSPLL